MAEKQGIRKGEESENWIPSTCCKGVLGEGPEGHLRGLEGDEKEVSGFHSWGIGNELSRVFSMRRWGPHTWMKVRKMVMPRRGDRNGEETHGWKGEEQFSLRSEMFKFEGAGKASITEIAGVSAAYLSLTTEIYAGLKKCLWSSTEERTNGSPGSHQLWNNGHKF